ncbi:GNAT family N-acetyltransferase [Gloeocapsa sp. BRSZ]
MIHAGSLLTEVHMEVRIEPYNVQQLDEVIRLSLRAWAPVFDSIQKMMDFDVYRELYPDWRVSQQKAVEDVCAAEDTNVWVAIASSAVVGFVAVKLDVEPNVGEIYMIAVDPDFQGCGVGSALIKFALDLMKDARMSVAMVATGGDPGHAPARHTYEKLGFRILPLAQYYKKL